MISFTSAFRWTVVPPTVIGWACDCGAMHIGALYDSAQLYDMHSLTKTISSRILVFGCIA